MVVTVYFLLYNNNGFVTFIYILIYVYVTPLDFHWGRQRVFTYVLFYKSACILLHTPDFVKIFSMWFENVFRGRFWLYSTCIHLFRHSTLACSMWIIIIVLPVISLSTCTNAKDVHDFDWLNWLNFHSEVL